MTTPGKRLKAEQIVNLLREIDVMTANGKTLLQACKQSGISDKSYYRYRKIYGGLKVDQARMMYCGLARIYREPQEGDGRVCAYDRPVIPKTQRRQAIKIAMNCRYIELHHRLTQPGQIFASGNDPYRRK